MITSAYPEGAHVPLMCINHTHLRWHTKNIDWIGARSIFFSGDKSRPGYLPYVYGPVTDDVEYELLIGGLVVECDCPISDLRPFVPDMTPDNIASARRLYDAMYPHGRQ